MGQLQIGGRARVRVSMGQGRRGEGLTDVRDDLRNRGPTLNKAPRGRQPTGAKVRQFQISGMYRWQVKNNVKY